MDDAQSVIRQEIEHVKKFGKDIIPGTVMYEYNDYEVDKIKG